MPGQQVLQRFLSTRAVRERELRLACLDEVHEGFVMAVDEEWVQLTITATLGTALVRLSNVTAMTETGVTLAKLPKEKRSEITEYTKLFRMIAHREIEK